MSSENLASQATGFLPQAPSSWKSQTRTHFNAVAAGYDSGPGRFAYFGKRLVAAAEIEPGNRVLDVASGRGAVLFPCAEQVGQTGEVVGVDFAEEMVRATNMEAALRGISARPPGWITEPVDLSKLLAAAGFNSVSMRLDSHSFQYGGIDEFWRQARGRGMRRVLDALSATEAERLRDALIRRVNPDGPREFYSTSTALIAVANR